MTAVNHPKSREAEAVQKVLHVLLAREYWILTPEHAGDEARCEAVEHSDFCYLRAPCRQPGHCTRSSGHGGSVLDAEPGLRIRTSARLRRNCAA